MVRRSRWMFAKPFRKGTVVRDYYSGQTDTVRRANHALRPAGSHGLLLLERAEANTSALSTTGATPPHFVLTDRFRNGDPTNDHNYGRHKDGMQRLALSTAAIYAG